MPVQSEQSAEGHGPVFQRIGRRRLAHRAAWQAQIDHGGTGEAAIVDEQQLQHIGDADIAALANSQRQQCCKEHRCRKKRKTDGERQATASVA